MAKLPFELRNEFVKGNLALFVGSGFVRSYVKGMPNWADLLQRVYATLAGNKEEIFNYCEAVYDDKGIRVIPSGEYLRLAQKFELARESATKSGTNVIGIHQQVRQAITDAYRSFDPASIGNSYLIHARNAGAPLNAWITTNYDTFIEDAFFRRDARAATLSRPVQSQHFSENNFADAKLLLKIHGCVKRYPPEDSIVITEEDYYRFLRQDRYLINKLYTLFCERTVVFMGYSLSDPNIQFIYHDFLFDHQSRSLPTEAASARFSNIRQAYFLSSKKPPEDQRVYYRQKRIAYVECEIEDFFKQLLDTYNRATQVSKDIVAKITANLSEYENLYQTIDWQVDPNAFPAELDQRLHLLEQMLDLIELFEKNYSSARQVGAPLPAFEHNRLVGTIYGSATLADAWCVEALREDRTEILELIIDFIRRVGPSDSNIFQRLINMIGSWLLVFPRSEYRALAHSFCECLFQYDENFNKWEDYTFMLEQFVRATKLWNILFDEDKRRVCDGLYHQLRMCGRSYGDSWYTTDRVYSVWRDFNEQAWPYLKERVENEAVHDDGEDGKVWYSHRDQAILDHLAPEADVTKFHPKV